MERTIDVAGVVGRKEQPLVKEIKSEPLVKRMLYGAWDGTKKVVESQSPEAWSKRIMQVVDETVVPKLSLETQERYRKLRPKIADAAVFVGVGITTAEIVALTTAGAKAWGWVRDAMELQRARKLVQYVDMGEGLPKMPVTIATRKSFSLSPETKQRVYQQYFKDAEETGTVLKKVRGKWKELQSTLGPHHWLREQLNGTVAALFDMTEDQKMKQIVGMTLKQSKGNSLSPEFKQVFQTAYREAARTYHWHTMPHDADAVYAFWRKRLDSIGLDELRQRVKRVGRPGAPPSDSVIAEMLKHIEHIPTVFNFQPTDWDLWKAKSLDAVVHKDPSAVSIMRMNRVLDRLYAKIQLKKVNPSWLNMIVDMASDKEWNDVVHALPPGLVGEAMSWQKGLDPSVGPIVHLAGIKRVPGRAASRSAGGRSLRETPRQVIRRLARADRRLVLGQRMREVLANPAYYEFRNAIVRSFDAVPHAHNETQRWMTTVLGHAYTLAEAHDEGMRQVVDACVRAHAGDDVQTERLAAAKILEYTYNKLPATVKKRLDSQHPRPLINSMGNTWLHELKLAGMDVLKTVLHR